MISLRARRTAAVVSATALVGAVPALAATKHGITPSAPKPGSSVDAGTQPTFTGRVKGPGPVYVYVSKSPKRYKGGLIDNPKSKSDLEMIRKAKKRKGRFSVKAPFFDYPEFWLNSPGTYYWQAHRIDCVKQIKDCAQEGPVVKFEVG